MKIKAAVPFVPVLNVMYRDEPKEAATQLTKLIEYYRNEGWEFSHLESVTSLRNNGCIAGLFGNPTTVVTFQVAIFEREDDATP